MKANTYDDSVYMQVGISESLHNTMLSNCKRKLRPHLATVRATTCGNRRPPCQSARRGIGRGGDTSAVDHGEVGRGGEGARCAGLTETEERESERDLDGRHGHWTEAFWY